MNGRNSKEGGEVSAGTSKAMMPLFDAVEQKKKKKRRKKSVVMKNVKSEDPKEEEEEDACNISANQERAGSPLAELKLDLLQRLWLDVNHIATLKKRSPKHVNALFVCKLCQYFCNSLEHCENHVKDQKHLRNSTEEGIYSTLVNLPAPTQFHVNAISEVLHNVANMYGISEEQEKQRQDIANQVNDILKQHLPGCEARLYGSSITGFGLKASNLNLDFVVEPTRHAPQMLKAAFNVLNSSELVACVLSDFHAEIPSLLFFDKTKTFNCILSLNSHEAHKTSELLAKYNKLDGRVKILGSCFRLWAKMCKIDEHVTGMLPSYSYNLLLVYFLQHHCSPPVLPVVMEDAALPDWTSSNTASVGKLWLELFRYYTVIHPSSDNVVCVRSDELVKRGEKHWTGKKIAIEDPYHRKRNVSRYIVNSASHDFIMDCFKNTYKYFGVPQTDVGPLYALIRTPMEEYRQIPEVERNIRAAEKSMDDMMNSDSRFMKANVQHIETTLNKMISVSELEEKLRGASMEGESRLSAAGDTRPTHYPPLVVSPKLAHALGSRLKKEFHMYKMEPKIFTAGQLPPIVCNICQQEGHTKSRCPDNYLPPLQPLPPMREEFMRQIDAVCQQILDIWSPTLEEVDERQSLVADLQEFLRHRYPAVKLELFGSSCNGFGFHKSDLDICLTFTDNKSGEGVNFVSLIEELVVELKAFGKLTNLIPITTAKVPIVKFTTPKSKLDCDISLYNTLAQENTRMLKLYSDIDERAKMLGFTIKRFAKLCDICDASRGSLSSYAYILMVIYFLQQCDPPVLPVLQQLCKDQCEEDEAASTWFYQDLKNLPKVWPEYGKNRNTSGELWLKLLRFYTEDFDFNEHVVCIRQKEKLLRFEKLWNSKCMAIEDPFDHSHNLGSGLSRKMNNFIIKAFRRGRMHFGSPISQLSPPYTELQDYLFDTKHLIDGQPPNDRGCRICKKIGHICKDCPQRKTGRRRQNERKPQRNEEKPRGLWPVRAAQSNRGNQPPPFRAPEQQQSPQPKLLQQLLQPKQLPHAQPPKQLQQALPPKLQHSQRQKQQQQSQAPKQHQAQGPNQFQQSQAPKPLQQSQGPKQAQQSQASKPHQQSQGPKQQSQQPNAAKTPKYDSPRASTSKRDMCEGATHLPTTGDMSRNVEPPQQSLNKPIDANKVGQPLIGNFSNLDKQMDNSSPQFMYNHSLRYNHVHLPPISQLNNHANIANPHSSMAGHGLNTHQSLPMHHGTTPNTVMNFPHSSKGIPNPNLNVSQTNSNMKNPNATIQHLNATSNHPNLHAPNPNGTNPNINTNYPNTSMPINMPHPNSSMSNPNATIQHPVASPHNPNLHMPNSNISNANVNPLYLNKSGPPNIPHPNPSMSNPNIQHPNVSPINLNFHTTNPTMANPSMQYPNASVSSTVPHPNPSMANPNVKIHHANNSPSNPNLNMQHPNQSMSNPNFNIQYPNSGMSNTNLNSQPQTPAPPNPNMCMSHPGSNMPNPNMHIHYPKNMSPNPNLTNPNINIQYPNPNLTRQHPIQGSPVSKINMPYPSPSLQNSQSSMPHLNSRMSNSYINMGYPNAGIPSDPNLSLPTASCSPVRMSHGQAFPPPPPGFTPMNPWMRPPAPYCSEPNRAQPAQHFNPPKSQNWGNAGVPEESQQVPPSKETTHWTPHL